MRLVPIIAVSIAALSIAACKPSADSAPQASAQGPGVPVPPFPSSSESVTRYQIVFSPHARADTFLVDTQRGRVWQLVKFKDVDGEPSAFDEVAVIDESGDIGMSVADFRRQYKVEKTGDAGAKKAPSPTFEDFTKGAAKSPGAKASGK